MVESAFVLFLLLAARVIYRLRFHPLAHVPGPPLAAISSLFLYAICYLGIEGSVIRRYHEKYKTKVLRVGPNAISVADSDAVRDIYVAGGGFLKDARYQNFNLGPVVSIFSSIDKAYRDVRAKAVAPIFSPARLREESSAQGSIGRHVADFVSQLSAFRQAKIKTDILDLCAKLSIDVVSDYVLGQPFGGLTEQAHLGLAEQQTPDAKLSANEFIHAIVGFARFSLLPNTLFKLVYSVSQKISHSDKVDKSFRRIQEFMGQVMKGTKHGKTTEHYQDRLLAAGISFSETRVQCEAILFAGGDSTAVMLATTLFHLTQNREARARLLHDIRAAPPTAGDNGRPDIPFLRACVKEGLRLGMANPTRLTRVVPPGANLTVDGISVPAGAVVGCAAYVLHHDPAIFPDPFAFRPERWIDDDRSCGLYRSHMEKSLIAFGAGLRACLGKNLAMQQLLKTVAAVVDSELLEGARTSEERIEVVQWFNGDIKFHHIDIEW
ncbi:cytochrome P450 [Colletotrichum orchidophilum]|uniref:Cytochrome P450 n=1 Tax=Colletotrichum orchidophilum TaxID=1209926 RepID=A0A1G4BTA6_9PEZI|nr:cytochrome P450 [Colletotrichum orchidophilum]OHF04566.1 cytochrome P450 [Colletotrichum orchidophilum]